MPVRPERIEASPLYIIRDLPRLLRYALVTESERSASDEACAALDPREQKLIVAHNPADIVIALQLLIDLTEAARAGRALAPLDCAALARRGERAPTEAECLADIAAIRPGDIDHAALPSESQSGVIRWVDTSGPNWTRRWFKFSFASGETVPSGRVPYGGKAPVPLSVTIGRGPELPILY